MTGRSGARSRVLVVWWMLAAIGCTRVAPVETTPLRAPVSQPHFDPDPGDTLPVPEGLAGESSDSATLTIEPDALSEEPSASEPETSGEPAAAEQGYDAVFSEEDVERFQEEESVLAGPLALYGAVVLQKVRDYKRWRARFDEQIQARTQAGFLAQGVMRGIDDDQLVAVWLAVTDVAHAKSFFGHSWRRLGVKARVKLSRNLAAEMEPDQHGLVAAIVTLQVEELAEFRAAFDATAPARAAAGLVGYSLGQDVDDEEVVYVYLQSQTSEALKAYLGARETKRIWKDATVSAIKNVTFVREGELQRCR